VASSPEIDPTDPVALADLLRHVHTEVSTGLHALLREEPWQLPPGQSQIIGLVTQRQPIRRRYYVQAEMSSEGENLIRNIGALVAEVGESLRECPRCQNIFLGRKRGLYCGRVCQQQEMAVRKTARRQRERRKPRRPQAAAHKKGD
jgi:hypothetical protein